MDFAAIDFETANEQPSSVCSVGVVIVKGLCVAIHKPLKVRGQPDWTSISKRDRALITFSIRFLSLYSSFADISSIHCEVKHSLDIIFHCRFFQVLPLRHVY